MADGPLYSKLMVEDNGFYVMDNTDDTLASGVSFDAGNVTSLISLAFQNKSGTIALTSDITSGTVAADDIIPGDSSVKITTTTGGLSIFTNDGTSLILGYNDGTNDKTQVALGLSTMYLGDDNGGGYTIYHDAQADGDDLTINQTGDFDASLNLYSSGTGTEAIYLGATVGGITLAAGNGVSVKVNSDDAIILSQGQMGLSGGADGSYTIDHATAGALTIQQTGEEDLIIKNTSTTGVVDINTNAAQAIKLQNTTYQFGVNAETTDNTATEIWTVASSNLSSGASASFFVKSQFSVVNGTSGYASGYEGLATYYWDASALTLKSQQIISHGDTTSSQNGTTVAFAVSDTSLQLNYTATSNVGTKVKGLVTTTVAN